MRRGRLGWVLLALAAILLLPSCSPRQQPSRDDEIWIYVDLKPDGRAEAEVWVRGKEAEVRQVSEAAAPLLFSGGVVESVSTVEDPGADLHGVIAVDAAFRPGPQVVAGFSLTELSAELDGRGYETGTLGLCWPQDGATTLEAKPLPDSAYDTCVYWDRFPSAVDITLTLEPKPERWLLRVPLILLTGALPIAAIVALKRSRRRPDGSRPALYWSLASFGALMAVFAFPPVGDPGTSLALAGLAGSDVAFALTVSWWVLVASWALLLYFVGPLLLLMAVYERRRARKLARAAQGPHPAR